MPGVASAAAPSTCADPAAALTVEEQRLAQPKTGGVPVLWGPFAQGIVERTLLPELKRIDMFATISQGRVGRFDVERYNGRWRGGFPDNDNVSSTGVIPIFGGVPTVLPAPEFVPTTLPL